MYFLKERTIISCQITKPATIIGLLMVRLASLLHIKLSNFDVLIKNSYNKLDFNADLFSVWFFFCVFFFNEKNQLNCRGDACR